MTVSDERWCLRITYRLDGETGQRLPRLQADKPRAWARMSEWARETHARNALRQVWGDRAEFVRVEEADG